MTSTCIYIYIEREREREGGGERERVRVHGGYKCMSPQDEILKVMSGSIHFYGNHLEKHFLVAKEAIWHLPKTGYKLAFKSIQQLWSRLANSSVSPGQYLRVQILSTDKDMKMI